ncbi:MAG TPA: hypothetical protein VF230_13110 [Acidimicrobiales bacterium]
MGEVDRGVVGLRDRLHYLLYAAARALYGAAPPGVSWGNEATYGALEFVVPWDPLVRAMDFVPPERATDLVGEGMFALDREGLVAHWVITPAGDFEDDYGRQSPPGGALVCQPTTVGIQLFMWAQGAGAAWRRYGDLDLALPPIDVEIPKSVRMADLPPVPS